MTGWLNELYGDKRVVERVRKERERAKEELKEQIKGFDRVKYQREYMRKRRAEKKGS